MKCIYLGEQHILQIPNFWKVVCKKYIFWMFIYACMHLQKNDRELINFKGNKTPKAQMIEHMSFL